MTTDKILIKLSVISIVCLSFIPFVVADDGSGCHDYSNTNLENPSWDVYCYVEAIYHQNSVLIQEQNQTNHLLAMEVCTHVYGPLDFSSGVFDKYQNHLIGGNQTNLDYTLFHKCIQQALGDSK